MTGPSIDLRWAGAARVGLGAALLLDLLRRAQVARTFFSNEGVLPNHVALLREHTLPTFYMSLSRPGEVAVGLALTAVVYLLFTIGFHTRVCHLLALACLVGLGLRNPLVQAPAEPLLAALLALTVTLPLGRRLSIDALRASLARRHEKSSAELADRESPAVSHRSIAVAVLVATWSLLHVLGCLDTTDASLGYLLHHDALVSGVGRALREPLSLPWVARGVRLALLALALLLLIPRARRLAALLAGLLYGGLALTTELDLFAFVRFLPFVLLLRTPGLAARWFARDSRKRTVIFDADCGICLLVSRVLVRLDPFRRLTFVGNDELERIPDAVPRDVLETSVVVIDSKGGVHTEERAVFEIGRALPFGILMLGWCGIPGLAAIGRRGYRAIAERRIAISSWLGLGACGMPHAPSAGGGATAPPPAEHPRLRAVVALSVAALIVAGVAHDSPWLAALLPPPPAAAAAARALGVAPLVGRPSAEHGRLVVDATLADGRHVDPLTGREPRLAAGGAALSPLWAAYGRNLRQPRFEAERAPFRSWLVARTEPRATTLTVWWVRERAPEPGARSATPLPPVELTRMTPLFMLGPKP